MSGEECGWDSAWQHKRPYFGPEDSGAVRLKLEKLQQQSERVRRNHGVPAEECGPLLEYLRGHGVMYRIVSLGRHWASRTAVLYAVPGALELKDEIDRRFGYEVVPQPGGPDGFTLQIV